MSTIFEAYSDESGFPAKRYHVISVVSGRREDMEILRCYLESVLQKGVSELKFEDVRGHRPKVKAAREFLRYTVKLAAKGKVRVDVLIWDTQDTRHSVVGRDDIANLHRMYYKVLVHVGRIWNQRDWHFYPDEGSNVDWAEIQKFLNKTRMVKRKPRLIALLETETQYFQLRHVNPRKSHDEPLIQLCDLFAGFAAFSREKGEEYHKWVSAGKRRAQPGLFEADDDLPESSSKADIVRFALLQEFDTLCKKHKLGVSVKTKGYLWTPDPKDPINFWNYEPQHEADKAPARPSRLRRGGV